MQGGFVFVDDKTRFRLIGLKIPIHIDHPLGGLEDVPHFMCQGDAGLLGGAVNFRHQCLKNRRSRRDLRHSHASSILACHRLNIRSNTHRNFMAFELALALAHQVDLDIRHIGAAAHEIMTNQAIKIKRRGGACIDLVISNFRFLTYGKGYLPSRLGGFLQGASLWHVENDLKFALVVERQHLDLHPANTHQGHGP